MSAKEKWEKLLRCPLRPTIQGTCCWIERHLSRSELDRCLVFACYRDDAQSKIVALKEKMDKELTQYNAEIKELIRVIDHDRKLKEFMSKKGMQMCVQCLRMYVRC